MFSTLRVITVNAHLKTGSDFIKTHDTDFYLLTSVPKWSKRHINGTRKQKSAYIIIRKCQNTRCTVVSKVHKHMILGATDKTMRAKVQTHSSMNPAGKFWPKFDDLTILVLTPTAHLLITFPLAWALSPFSTARKLIDVTFYREHPIRSHKSTSNHQFESFLYQPKLTLPV